MEQGVLPGSEEVVLMAQREIDKLHVIRNFLEGRMKRAQVAKVLDLSERQVSTLARRVQGQGAAGVVHGLRGRASNHQLDPCILERAMCALEDPLWHDFGPTFAQEQLYKRWRIHLGVETLRQLMITTEHWRPGTRKARHRARRERRPCLGMMVQLDGSPHAWFEDRGPEAVLIQFIDDATSCVLYAEFVECESTATLMRTTKTYLLRYGRPVAFYVDRHSAYRVNRESTVEEELQGEAPLTQYGRAMKQLGIELIKAWSPQAKGRVERGFGTHQDRLVKELRLRGISTIPEANPFLWDTYLPNHNNHYAVAPAESRDAHRPLLASHDLDTILAVHVRRKVQNDYVVQHNCCFLQLDPEQPVQVRPGDRVFVVEGLDGSIRIGFKGRFLKFRTLPERPYRPFYHPKLRSRCSSELLPFYGVPARHSPLPGPFDSFRFDPARLLQEQARKEALLNTA